MTSNHGFVKSSTKVLFDDTRYLQKFDSHPFSHRYAIVRKTIGEQPFDKLRCLENEILELLKTSTNNYTAHKYGANEGLNCGLSCAGGGTLSNEEDGISGTVQWSSFIKRQPELMAVLIGFYFCTFCTRQPPVFRSHSKRIFSALSAHENHQQ